MRGFKVLAVLTAVTMVAPAMAADTSDKKDPNKRICKLQKDTGSRVSGQRICKTRAEWEQIAEESKRFIENGLPNERVFNGDNGGNVPR